MKTDWLTVKSSIQMFGQSLVIKTVQHNDLMTGCKQDGPIKGECLMLTIYGPINTLLLQLIGPLSPDPCLVNVWEGSTDFTKNT